LRGLKLAKEVDVDVVGQRHSGWNCTCSSAGESDRWEYVKLHVLSDLEARTAEML